MNGEAAITEWIILELMAGVRSSETAEHLLSKMEPLPRLSVTEDGWRLSWSLAARLRKKAISVGAADCFIATIAIGHDVPLVHCDRDFELISRHSELRTVDWTAI
jgi:predicted nucleic acid-binding protein